MKHLAKDAGGKVVEDAEKKKDALLATFNKHLHNKYDRYFQTFIGCEVLNLVILVSQVNSGERNHNPLYNSGVSNQCFPWGHLPHVRGGRPHVLPESPRGEPETRTAQSHVRGIPKGGSSLLLIPSFSILDTCPNVVPLRLPAVPTSNMEEEGSRPDLMHSAFLP